MGADTRELSKSDRGELHPPGQLIRKGGGDRLNDSQQGLIAPLRLVTGRYTDAVRAVFADLDGFHSAQEVHALLRSAGDPVGLSTVYRTVQSLADDGELDSIRTDSGEALYRLCSTEHHHHLVCRDCGRITEIGPDAIRPLITALEDRHGFETDVGHLTVFGRCAECRAVAHG